MIRTLWCSPGVFMAKVDNDLIVLDIDKDAYHCMLATADALRLGNDGALTTRSAELADALLDAGLALPTAPAQLRLAPISAERELSSPSAPQRVKLVRVAIAWGAAALAFQRKPLKDLIRFGNTCRRGDSACDETLLCELVGAARIARSWMPFEGECLQRSFQLRCILAERGIATDWVFGVRTWPFNAHCWLQRGDLVIGDRLARVRRYTPIMRV